MVTFENIEAKGEIGCNEYFLLFPQYFLLLERQILLVTFNSSSANVFNLARTLLSGKSLKYIYANSPSVSVLQKTMIFKPEKDE